MIRRIISLHLLEPFRDETSRADIAWFIRSALCSIPFVEAASVGLTDPRDASQPWDMVVLIDMPDRAQAQALHAHPEYRALLHGYLQPKLESMQEHDFTFVEEYSPLQDR